MAKKPTYRELEQRVKALERELTGHGQTDESLNRRMYDLGERTKELRCLYGISRLFENRVMFLGQILQGVVALVPPAWQYPEITCARIIVEGEEYRTENFRETTWKQAGDILVSGTQIGTMEVCYLEARPESYEGPFLREERSLINDITERLGAVIKQRRMEQELREASDKLEQRVRERTVELVRANEQLRREMEQRRHVEESLRDSEGKYSTLVEISLTGIFMVQDGKISFANKRFAEAHDYSREELVGMDELLLVDEEDRPLVTTMRQRRLKGEQVPSIYEVKALKKGGEPMWVQRRITLTDYKGNPAILGNSVDITKRKRAEEELQQSEKQLRLLSSQLLTAQEEERKRIARELHDGIGQSLSAIKFRVENALEELDQEATGRCVTLLDPIVPVVQGAVEEVRRIARNLRPSILDDLGILATVSWLCREFETIYSGIRIEKQVDIREEEVPDVLKIVIYRILQEALNNVAKHSEADLISLSLRAQGGKLELSISDNGVGFDVADTISGERQGGGLGLASMKERGELSGGSFSIESSRGTGTIIRALWPCGAKRQGVG